MKLSMWTSYYMDLSPEDAILELEKCGYRYCELSDEHAATLLERGDAKEVGKAFGEFARAHNVEVLQGHLYLKVRLCDTSEPVISIMKNWFDLFLAIGIKSAVLHCDKMANIPDVSQKELREKNLAVLRPLIDYLKGTDMVVCLENLCAPHIKTADDLLWFVNELQSENIGICLDTGHLNMVENKDQVAFIQAAGKHLKALHIADNEGARDQHLIPFGVGNVDFEVVVRELKKIGYDRLFNFEVPGERRCPLQVRAYKLEYIKKCYEYLMK